MSITASPYLSFPQNNCRQAMTFYGSVFGADPSFTPLAGMPGIPDDSDLIMHSELKAPEITLMGADNCGGWELRQGNCFTIGFMVSAVDAARGRELFEQLSEGGDVRMPLEAQPWGDLYGEFTDRFGVQWSFNIGQADESA